MSYCPVVQKTQFDPSEFMQQQKGDAHEQNTLKEQLFSLMLGFCISQVYATRKLRSLQEGQSVLKIWSAMKYIQCLSQCLDNKRIFFPISKGSFLDILIT